MMNRLDTIANRQRSSRVRDALFAAAVALAAVISVSTVATAASVATNNAAPATTHIASR